ncbi:MAG: hypothetical protein BWX50_00671 [Euryarchaeota archaeon ADurb.Bin009]|nr:MAG: hypothetical protein BWX50_00671 [Euryarchaeota archaeon ADurb.Bin009]
MRYDLTLPSVQTGSTPMREKIWASCSPSAHMMSDAIQYMPTFSGIRPCSSAYFATMLSASRVPILQAARVGARNGSSE